MRVVVVGAAGYVGVVTATGLAHLGHRVTGVDIDARQLAHLQAGRASLAEPGLQELLDELSSSGLLHFTSSYRDVAAADVVVICVATPVSRSGQPDLAAIRSVMLELRERLSGYTVITFKSTVPTSVLGMARSLLGTKLSEGVDYDLAVNPEFLREGSAVQDFLQPDRVVIGATAPRARDVLDELYAPLAGLGVPVLLTDPISAILIKYAANAFLATRISLINEIASLCEVSGGDVTEVARGIGLDPRIGTRYLQPGPGFGGPCLEKDLQTLLEMYREHRLPAPVFAGVLARNHLQIEQLVQRITDLVGVLRGERIAILGLAFKPGTSDVRSSLSLRLMDRLLEAGAQVVAHDPVALPEARRAYARPVYVESAYAACRGAVVAVLMTDWPEYKTLDFVRLREQMKQPCLIDARNAWDPTLLQELGFTCASLGRPAFVRRTATPFAREAD